MSSVKYLKQNTRVAGGAEQATQSDEVNMLYHRTP